MHSLEKTILTAFMSMPSNWALSARLRFFRGTGQQAEEPYISMIGWGILSKEDGYTNDEAKVIIESYMDKYIIEKELDLHDFAPRERNAIYQSTSNNKAIADRLEELKDEPYTETKRPSPLAINLQEGDTITVSNYKAIKRGMVLRKDDGLWLVSSRKNNIVRLCLVYEDSLYFKPESYHYTKVIGSTFLGTKDKKWKRINLSVKS